MRVKLLTYILRNLGCGCMNDRLDQQKEASNMIGDHKQTLVYHSQHMKLSRPISAIRLIEQRCKHPCTLSRVNGLMPDSRNCNIADLLVLLPLFAFRSLGKLFLSCCRTTEYFRIQFMHRHFKLNRRTDRHAATRRNYPARNPLTDSLTLYADPP